MSRTALRAIPIIASLAVCAPIGAAAETVIDEETFRDWTYRFEYNPDTGEANAFVYTGRVADYEGEELASRIVVILTHTGEPIVYLDVPDRAEPAAGFELQVDQQPPFNGRFNDCSTGWCHTQAIGDIAQELVRQFRGGSEAKVSFVLDEALVQIDLPLSLLGFTAAYTRMNEVHAELVAAMIEQQEEAAQAETEQPEGAEVPVAEDPEASEGEGAADEGGEASDGETAEPDAEDVPDADEEADAPAEPPAEG